MKNLIFILLLSALSFSACAKPHPSEVLHLKDNYPLINGKPSQYFLLSNSLHKNIIEIKNEIGDVKADLTCDGKVSLKQGFFSLEKTGDSHVFQLKNNKSAYLTFGTDVNSCLFKLSDKSAIRLVKDEVQFPFLKRLNRSLESCNYQSDDVKNQSVDGLFLTNKYPMMTCAHPAFDIEILDRSEDGLLSKMEALLGYRPSIDFIHNQNPYAELDFSKAPKLKAIFVSTLLYRHDFTGAVLGRLLRFHAERGALINIIGTGYMHGDKDKALLKELSQVSGNIRIQEYKYLEARKGPKGLMTLVDNFLRDMHVKMFVTLSDDSQYNTLIMGGRNIHDGFVFAEKPDFSKFPELDQSPEGAYAYWNDLEIKIRSTELAESVYAQLLKLWNREIVGQVMADTKAPAETSKKIDGEEVLNSENTMMRHFLTLPFNDDHALEKLYVEMIDKAQTSIKLSSPYLRPTKAIMAAFERAIARKVDITIQTRIDLKGDTQAWLYEETNKAAINSLYDRVHLYEWTENSILHTKMLLVDDKFAFFGSVNLSRRSFIQDVENGFVIHHEKFVQRLVDVFDGYTAKSRKLDQRQKRKFWASVVVFIAQDQF